MCDDRKILEVAGPERRMTSRSPRRLQNESGMTLAFVAILLVILLGLTALAVDLGMLMGARAEAQRVADAAALAGAGVLSGAADDEAVARSTAIQYAALNDIRKVAAEVLEEDVDVEPDNWLVRVRTFRIEERGNPMTNVFARAFGVDTSDVSAVAAARWNPAGGASCLLPFVLPDRWWIGGVGGPFPTVDDIFDESRGDTYVPHLVFNEDGELIEEPDPYSGYDGDARGTEIRLKTSNPDGTWGPGVYFPIRFPGQLPGGDAYRERIATCPEPDVEWYPGMLVNSEPGNMIGPTAQGFRDLINQAPNHTWDPTQGDGGCVWDPNRPGGAGCIPDFDSPRSRPVAMFAPDEFPGHPPNPFRIVSFVGVFVDRVQGNNVYVVFVAYQGAQAIGGGSDLPVLGRILQLVE